MSKVLAFGGFALAGAFILDQSCDGGRTLNFFREKLVTFKRWVAGDDRKEEFKAILYVEGNEPNPDGAGNQANPDVEGNQANPDVEGNEPNPDGAGNQANPDGAGNQANQDDVVNELNMEMHWFLDR